MINADISEEKRRRREKVLIFVLASLFLVLTWIEFRLFGMSESLPFQHSIFFFGLVNFNIILFLLLMFLIFRNIVKNFADREGGPLGSSLKSKLIAAFVGFSFVPTALMFTVSVFYINNSFDRWFNEKTSGILKNSLEVTNSYYVNAKKRNYHFAELVGQAMSSARSGDLKKELSRLRERYALDVVEYYPDLFSDRVVSVAPSELVPRPPEVSMEFLKKGIAEASESSTIHHYAGGDLIRVIVPVRRAGQAGAVVVSSYVPLSLISKMDDIASAYENFKDSDPLAYPIKSIYLIILILMTLVILLGATWFGFYLARQLSVPLEKLAQATQRVVKGDYQKVEQQLTGSPEINRLIENFNTMTQFLGQSERELMEANQSLRKTLNQLDEHSRYIEVVLTHVTTGVISIDEQDTITMINRHAEKLLDIESGRFVGQHVQSVLTEDYYKIFSELISQMKEHKAETIEKEIQLTVKNKPLILQMTVTMLYDEAGQEIGKVLVFDDMSVVLAAQRAAAWTEVARRIAHEIKNPLTPISLAAQRLQRKFGESVTDPAFKECTTMIVDQVDGLKNLVNEFSQFARMPKIQPEMADLNRAVQDAVRLFAQGAPDCKISFAPAKNLPVFAFDVDQIKRVVTNLVDNAVESVKSHQDGFIEVSLQYDPALRIAQINVADNGSGIPAYLKGRLFEPYMTTKNHGTGLGLAIVKRTVEDHNGYVRAFDNKPRGTRFVVELPVVITNTASTIIPKYDGKTEEGNQV